MLPLYDPELNVKELNIFQPLESILPYDLPKCNSSDTGSIGQTTTTTTTTTTATSPFANDNYCKACKKKFNNAITYTNHLKTAKHIANEKKLKPTPSKPKTIAVHPQVQEALNALDEAEKTKDASVCATTCWTLAQTLYALKRPQYAERALLLLIDRVPQSTTFSSAQVTSFLYNSRLALARLLCLYSHMEEARSVYLAALAGKWKLETAELLDIASRVRRLTVTDVISACDALATKYLTRERNRTKPAPALTDANNAITTIVCEAANLFAQEDQQYKGIRAEYVAVVLYATCSLTCQYEGGMQKQDFYFFLKTVYTSLGDLEHRIIEIDLLGDGDDDGSVESLFNALLMAIEIDDLVRAKSIAACLEQACQLYPDVKLLCDICKSRCTLYECNPLQQLEFVALLLEQTSDALVIRDFSQQEQRTTIDRIRDCIVQQ